MNSQIVLEALKSDGNFIELSDLNEDKIEILIRDIFKNSKHLCNSYGPTTPPEDLYAWVEHVNVDLQMEGYGSPKESCLQDGINTLVRLKEKHSMKSVTVRIIGMENYFFSLWQPVPREWTHVYNYRFDIFECSNKELEGLRTE